MRSNKIEKILKVYFSCIVGQITVLSKPTEEIKRALSSKKSISE